MYIFEPYVKNKWSIPVLTFCVLSQFSNPIQGLYRYFHFRLHITLKPLHIFGIYCACCACVTAVGILHVLSYEPFNDVPKAIEIITEMPYWREHSDKLSGFYVGSLLSVYMIFSVIALLILINIGAGCLLFFNHQVNSYLKTLKVHMASKTIQLQKQISRQLMLQFCLPGMIGGIGIVSASCLMFLPEYSGGVVMLMFCPFQWVPVLNPIITIMCIADYRRQLLRLLKGKNTTVGSTIVVPTATGHVDSKNQQGSGTVHTQF
uniref:7TM GPCR serpentine receptor class x (Srx) domain-containing protein n=1 Tax=Panagrellus redivivus TaxID=6233 RepID=A0A7E4WD90_PANRE